MANEGFNKVRIRTCDVPNIDSGIGSNSYKPTIKGQTAALSNVIGHLEFGHSCSRTRVLDCDSCPMA